MGSIYANGIDTSKWQNSKVDYYKAKQCGIEFVLLRIGYNKTKDKNFEADYKAAKAAGLKVGVYFYTLATTVSEALADATRVLGWLNNRHLDLPIAYDVEDAKQKSASMKAVNTNMYNSFASKIKSYGVYTTMLYTGEYFFNNYFAGAQIKDPLWIAQYTHAPQIGRLVSIWQYSSDPVDTPYFKGKLDVNYLLADNLLPSNDSLKLISLNPYPEPTRLIKLTLVRQKGNDVKWVQHELYQKGYLKLSEIDGIWGTKSDAALKLYQRNHGLLVDGKCGTATRYSMKND